MLFAKMFLPLSNQLALQSSGVTRDGGWEKRGADRAALWGVQQLARVTDGGWVIAVNHKMRG